MVGHSLGAAISLLDSVYLPLHISGVTFKSVLYGLPRVRHLPPLRAVLHTLISETFSLSLQVGNQDFANYVDAHVSSVTHINNEEDPVPILPGMFLGFHHPSGEVHITDAGVWESCPGTYYAARELRRG